MKNVLKKGIAALLAVSAALFSFAGCSSNKKEADEVVELTYYSYNNVSEDDAEVIEKINEYTVDKIGVKVNWINIAPAEYKEKMRMVFASGEPWDVCFAASYTDYFANVDNGIFMELDELLKNEGKEIYDLTPEWCFDAARVDGKVYALPVIKDVASHWNIACKTQLLGKYNIDVDSIKKLEDLTPVYQTIKDNEPGMIPVLARGNNPLTGYLGNEDIAGCSIGAFVNNDYNKIVNEFETQEMKDFLALMREWYKKGFIRSDAATATNDNDIRAANKFFSGWGEYLPYSELQTNIADDKKTTPLLGLGKTVVRTNNVLGAGFAISSKCEYPEKAMELINLINTDKYLRNLITLGVEGKHWVAVGDNQYTLPEGIATKKDTGYNPVEYPAGNRFIMRTTVDVPEDIWEKYEEFNESAKKSDALGFVFNVSSVTTEIAAIENVYQEFVPALVVGAVDPDEMLPKFLDKLKVAGVDKVLAEMNKQYSEWKKSR